MRIKEIYIENFGSLHDLSLKPEEGLNSFLNDNGYGKTTLCFFLLSMFYGLSGERKKSPEDNIRQRFLPWQGGVFGGSLTIKVKRNGEDKTYRIERSFGSRKQEDVFRLFDIQSGDISNDFNENIGEELFKIDEESFKRTFFIEKSDLQAGLSSEIHSRISVIDDMRHYEDIEEYLKGELNRLSMSRKTGEIFKRKLMIERLSQGLEKKEEIIGLLKDKEKKLYLNRQSIEKLEKELSDKENCLEELFNLRTEYLKNENIKIKSKEFYETEKKISLDEEKINFSEEAVNSKDRENEALARYERLLRRYGDLAPSEEDMLKMSCTAEKLSSPMFRKKANPLVMLLIILFSGILIFFQGLSIMNVFPLAAGLILTGFYLYYISKKNSLRLMENKEKLKNLYEFLKKYSLEESFEKEGLINKKKHFVSPKLSDFLLREAEYASELKILTELCECYKKREELKSQGDFKDGYSMENLENERDLSNPKGYESVSDEKTFKELTERISSERDALKEKIELLKQETEEEKEIIKNLSQEETDLLEREEECLHENSMLYAAEEKYRRLSEIRKAFERARDSFSMEYGRSFIDSFKENFSSLNGDPQGFTADSSLRLHYMEKGKERDIMTLSEGIRQAVEFSKRIAVTDCMYKDDRPFLVMDDPFSSLDDAHLSRALEFVKALSLKYQIFYFTCHETRLVKSEY